MKKLALFVLVTLLAACSSQEVPQAHKGRMFDKTGGLALWSGGDGFVGDILGPGTYYTGVYDDVRMVECAINVRREELKALTSDGVQFGLDVYVRYGASCDDQKAVFAILDRVSPAYTDPEAKGFLESWPRTVFGVQLYDAYIRPALGEAVRRSVSTHVANSVNANRDKIFDEFRKSFTTEIEEQKPRLVIVHELNLSNLDFPEQLDTANVARAEQAVLKDKAVAERERVTAEIETAHGKRTLAEAEGGIEAARIDKIGEALKRNPDYLQYQMQQSMPGIYADAGQKGNMVIAAPTPVMVQHGQAK